MDLFFIIEHLIGILKVIISYAVDDVPGEVQAHLERQRHIVDVLINDIPEEDEDFGGGEEVEKDFATTWNYDKVTKIAPKSRNPFEEKSPV